MNFNVCNLCFTNSQKERKEGKGGEKQGRKEGRRKQAILSLVSDSKTPREKKF